MGKAPEPQPFSEVLGMPSGLFVFVLACYYLLDRRIASDIPVGGVE